MKLSKNYSIWMELSYIFKVLILKLLSASRYCKFHNFTFRATLLLGINCCLMDSSASMKDPNQQSFIRKIVFDKNSSNFEPIIN